MLLSVAKDAYLNNCSKTTHYAHNYLLNCSILFFLNSSSKASGLLFIFVHVSTGHAHFPNDEIYTFLGCPWGLVHCFSLVKCLKSLLGKLASKSVDGRYTLFSIGKETHLRGRAYLCVIVKQALFSLYYLYTGCFQASSKGLLMWVRKDKQMYIHTHTFCKNNFRKPGWFKNKWVHLTSVGHFIQA